MFEIREVQDRVSERGMCVHDSTIRLICGYVKYIITKKREHTSGPVGHNARLEEGNQGANWEGQQGAAGDADAVGDYVAEFHGAAGGEMLSGFYEGSQKEHREAR
jgi:hypothetical protein